MPHQQVREVTTLGRVGERSPPSVPETAVFHPGEAKVAPHAIGVASRLRVEPCGSGGVR